MVLQREFGVLLICALAAAGCVTQPPPPQTAAGEAPTAPAPAVPAAVPAAAAKPAAAPAAASYLFAGDLEGDAAGREVDGVGDVDGDGVPDLAVGSPGADNLAGKVVIYSGASGLELHRLRGNVSGIVFGREIAGLGDLDKDGRADFVVTAPQSDLLVDGRDLPDAGSVYVYSGADARLLYRFDGADAGQYAGKAVATAGDFDQDGTLDFLYTAPFANRARGETYVHSGATGQRLLTVAGSEPGARYGWTVTGGFDVDGDRRPDVVVGAPWSSLSGRVNSGTVFVYAATGALLYKLEGEAAGDGFGNSVALLGDIDGDGAADLVVGAPLANPAGLQDAGSVYLYSGRQGTLLARFDGTSATGLLGFSVANGGDVDGDRVDDALAGGQWIDPGDLYNAGSAFVYSGARRTEIFRFDGTERGAELGFAVAAAGDLNRDGRAELLIGAPGDRDFAGSARVVNTAGGQVAQARAAGSAKTQ